MFFFIVVVLAFLSLSFFVFELINLAVDVINVVLGAWVVADPAGVVDEVSPEEVDDWVTVERVVLGKR